VISIEYICFLGNSGFGFAARNYILALHQSDKFDIKITYLDTPISKGINFEHYDLFKKLSEKKDNSNAIQVYHCIPDLFRRVKRKARAIAIATFEAQPAPSNWLVLLEHFNGIIFPSQFCYDLFLDLKRPKIVIPHCLDLEKYKKTIMQKLGKDIKGKSIYNWPFYFLFCGTWKKRKGIEILIAAWNEEKLFEQNCYLTIKTGSSGKIPLASSLGEKINVDTSVYKDEDMPRFFAGHDCLVAPTLGEAFMIPGLQSLACGVPIITTNFSGVQEYASPATAYLLEPEGFLTTKSPMDNYFQFGKCSWPYISVKQLREKMRYVFEHQEEAKEMARKAQDELSRKFSYGVVAEKFEMFLGRIYGEQNV
jgi:glycosyltransferase involved in cell wall biosynthesis